MKNIREIIKNIRDIINNIREIIKNTKERKYKIHGENARETRENIFFRKYLFMTNITK